MKKRMLTSLLALLLAWTPIAVTATAGEGSVDSSVNHVVDSPLYATPEKQAEESLNGLGTQTVDMDAPELISASLDKDVYYAGETAYLTVVARDKNAVAYMFGYFRGDKDPSTDIANSYRISSNLHLKDITKNSDGDYVGVIKLQVKETIESDIYRIGYISLRDSFGNEDYKFDHHDYASLKFQVINPNPDLVDMDAPKLLSASLDKDIYYAGETAYLTVVANDKNAVGYLLSYFKENNGNPADQTSVAAIHSTMYAKDIVMNAEGDYVGVMELIIPETTVSSIYRIDYILLEDGVGNREYVIDHQDYANLKFQVINPNPDLVDMDAPELINASLDKDIYNVGETAYLTIVARDKNAVTYMFSSFIGDKSGTDHSIYSNIYERDITKNSEGDYVGVLELRIQENVASDIYRVRFMVLEDGVGNRVNTTNHPVFDNLSFIVINPEQGYPYNYTTPINLPFNISNQYNVEIESISVEDPSVLRFVSSSSGTTTSGGRITSNVGAEFDLLKTGSTTVYFGTASNPQAFAYTVNVTDEITVSNIAEEPFDYTMEQSKTVRTNQHWPKQLVYISSDPEVASMKSNGYTITYTGGRTYRGFTYELQTHNAGTATLYGYSNGELADMITVKVLADPTFVDVPRSHWAFEFAEELYARDIITGYADGTYRVNEPLKRGQAAKMISRAAGLDYEGKTAGFPDVVEGHEMSPYIAALVEAGAVKGLPDGTYKMYNNMTRRQIAQVIVKVYGLDYGDLNVDFTDLPTDGSEEYIKILASNGIVSGYEDGTFRPNQPVTRAQFSKILMLAIESAN